MSYAVLFPVVIRSPVVPFPNCPFSPLPKEKTKVKDQSRQKIVASEAARRTFSRPSKDERESNTRRRLHGILLLPIVPYTTDELELCNFVTNRMSTLFRSISNRVEKSRDKRNEFLTCPRLLAPALHTFPSLPTKSVWFLPHAAWTNLVPSSAPNSTGKSFIGAFSEMYSSPAGPDGIPSAPFPLRPKSHAAPSEASTTKWQPLHEVWTDTASMLLSERRMCGSRSSGFLVHGSRQFRFKQ